MDALRWMLLTLVIVVAGTSAHAADLATDDAAKFDIAPLIHAGLLDPAIATDQRRALAQQLIDAADRQQEADLLYLVGSLYRQGDSLGIAPFPQDIAKARDYLTRSAEAGDFRAMGKLATLELDVDNVFDANLWAQLYARYSRQRSGGRSNQGVAAALLGRALPLLPRTEEARLLNRRNAFVAAHDATIQAYVLKINRPRPDSWFAGMKMHNVNPVSAEAAHKAMGSINTSGVAEYFVEFDRKGKLVKVWRFDAWPSSLLFDWMQQPVESLTIKAAKRDAPDRRTTILPMTYVDPTSKLQSNGFTPDN